MPPRARKQMLCGICALLAIFFALPLRADPLIELSESQAAYLRALEPIPFFVWTGAVFAGFVLLTLVWNRRLRTLNLKLRQSEKDQSLLLNNLPGVAYRCLHDENWTMTYITPGCLKLTGYSHTEFLEKQISYADLLHPEDRDRLWTEVNDVIRQQDIHSSEYRITHRSGEVRWVWEQAQAIKDPEGKVLHYEGLLIDITPRKVMETELAANMDMQKVIVAASRDFLNATPERIDDIINAMLAEFGQFLGADRTYFFRGSPDGEIISNSHEWCADEIQPFRDHLRNLRVDELPPYFQKQIVEMQPIRIEDAMALPPGMAEEKEMLTAENIRSMMCIPLSRGENFFGLLGFDTLRTVRILTPLEEGMLLTIGNMLTDMLHKSEIETAMIRARDQAEAANQAKNTFLANISHEIRTPLNGVIGMTHLLKASKLTDEQSRWVNAVESSGRTLLNLINDILDFARIEEGQMRLHPMVFPLKDLLEDLANIMEPATLSKGLRFSCTVQEEIPPYWHGDAARLRQILTNLAGNAVKFTDQGSVSIEVSSFQERGEGSCRGLRFAVTDTGIGIPPEKAEQIFEKFTQLKESASRLYGGSGLGLSITRELVELMGGEIWVEHPEAGGSRFVFTVKLEPADTPDEPPEYPLKALPSVPAEKRSTSTPHAEPQSKAKILLVEDNKINQQVALGILRKFQLKADVAENGREALERLAEKDYELVLMDLQMPVMGGLDATERIRKGAAGVRNPDIPIIATTAHVGLADREKCLRAGMNGYLEKPVSPAALGEVLSAWLTAATDEPAWNKARMYERLLGDESMALQIARNFEKDLQRKLESLHETAAARDLRKFQELTHTMKGAAGSVEAPGIERLAREMEAAAATRKSAVIGGIFRKLREECARFQAELADA